MKRKRSELFSEKSTEPPRYYIEQEFRKVMPYYHEYTTFAKERWVNRELESVFSTDFKDKPSQYYRNAIKNSLITINGEATCAEYIVRPNDVISHLIHRHEPPVLAKPLNIIQDNDDVIVVDKPPSIPVHPSGRYNHNTLVGILKHEMGLDHLSVINRLDRLTSGIVILAKTTNSAAKLHKGMEDGLLKKEYICKVKGNFPDDVKSCSAPIKTVSFKLGLNVVSADGKDCLTLFEKIKCDGAFSYLIAKPITGRTHQIRVHLHHLGFPIVNDPLYNESTIWGDRAKELHLTSDQVKQIVSHFEGLDNEYSDGVIGEYDCGADIACLDCMHPKRDPDTESLYICLHAYKYSGPGFCYETKYPKWASSAVIK